MYRFVVIALLLTTCAAPPAAKPSTTTAMPVRSESPRPTTPVSADATPSPLPTPDASLGLPAPYAVRFADATHGWLGVADGILGSNDGGMRWVRELTSGPVGRIWTVDAKHAWAQSGDAMYRTVDGSAWQLLPPTVQPIIMVDMLTPLIGWAVMAPRIDAAPITDAAPLATLLATTDGGAVWRPITATHLWSVCFSDERDGLGAIGKRIYRTSDGGRTWSFASEVAINDKGPWSPELICAGPSDARVQIVEPYAALSHAPYIVFATNDAGKTWRQEYVEGYTLGSVVGLPAPGLGSYPSIFGTLPDRTTWIVTCSPPADTQTFIILSASGSELKNQVVPFQACARSASFVDASLGWAIALSYARGADRNIVVRTTDGARSWSLVYPR